MLSQSTRRTPRSDDHPGFRWWDYGVLTIFSAALFLFCGVLAVRQYDQTDARRLAAVSVDPQSLPTPICTIGKFKLAESTGRTLCYDVHN
jgi:hypothetical protein